MSGKLESLRRKTAIELKRLNPDIFLPEKAVIFFQERWKKAKRKIRPSR